MRLKEILKDQKMTGSELARRIGVKPQYIHGLIRGDNGVSVKKLLEIAEALNVPPAALFEGYEDNRFIYCPHCGKKIRVEIVDD